MQYPKKTNFLNVIKNSHCKILLIVLEFQIIKFILKGDIKC